LVAPVVAIGVDVVAAEDVVLVFADDGDGVAGHQDQYWGVCVGAADAEVVSTAKKLFADGYAGHADVCAALGLSDNGGHQGRAARRARSP
jgi:hypothetical protein